MRALPWYTSSLVVCYYCFEDIKRHSELSGLCPDMNSLVVPKFVENGIFMLGLIFSFSQFSPIEIIVFNKIFLYPIEDINFLSSNVERLFYLRLFFVKFLGFENCQNKLAMIWTNLWAFWRVYSWCWERNANHLCVAKYPAQQNRSKLNWGELIGHINYFTHSEMVKIYRFFIFTFPKNYSIWIKGHSGLCPDIRAVKGVNGHSEHSGLLDIRNIQNDLS